MGIVGWGRAFNLRFMPNGPLRTNCYHRPMPRVGIFGGGGNMSYTENINIQQGPTGFWGFMTGLTQGLFGGGMFGCGMGGGLFGMGGCSPYAALNSAQTKQGAEQPKAEDKYLTSLTSVLGAKGTFSKHPDKDGIYIMTTKDGKVIEDTYQNLLDKFKEEPEVNKAPEVVKDYDVDKDHDVDKAPEVKQKAKGSSSVKEKSPIVAGSQTQWTPEEMAKPHRLQVTFAIRLNASSTATVVTPDGKTHVVNAHTFDRWTAKDILGEKMLAKLKDDGWTDVTLENKQFDWSSDGSKATGQVDKPEGADKWTKDNKAKYNKPHKITFAVSPNSGYSGSATVTTPDGKLHQVTTGPSLGASRARKDLVKQMISALKADGWTQATVTNDNWPEDC